MAKALTQSPMHSSLSIPYSLPQPQSFTLYTIPPKHSNTRHRSGTLLLRRSNFVTAAASGSPAPALPPSPVPAPPVIRKRVRYRKEYPGENVGITEEMRFVAMRLRNVNGKKYTKNDDTSDDDSQDSTTLNGGTTESESDGGEADTWQPSMEGFLKYLVDSEVVFNTVERIVDDSNDVAYAYFRKTGLERSAGISKDLEWFREQGMVIPEPTNAGVSYGKYLEEVAEKSAPLFLSHFYNIYFSHIAGGQVIVKQVSEKLLDGRELEIFRWETEVQDLLKGVREKLNMLGEHWSRDEKNKCLRESSKSFRFLGQIVRLIIL